MRKGFLLLATLMLATGLCLGGCAPAPPPPPSLHSPVSVPGWDWLVGPMYCLTPLVTLAAIVLIIAVILSLLRGKGSSIKSSFKSFFESPSGPSAKEIVQERYARGEISREEYRQLLKDLEESGQA